MTVRLAGRQVLAVALLFWGASISIPPARGQILDARKLLTAESFWDNRD